MGSYGYLCNFHYEDHKEIIDSVIGLDEKITLDERLRLKLNMPINPEREIYRGNDMLPTCKTNVDGYHIFNEIVVDRGPSPFAI